MKVISSNSPEVRNYIKYIALLLLLLNGTGAFVGGIPMILWPDGSANGISITYLEHSPFDNYLIPGIILVGCNGVLSVFVFIALAFNLHAHSRYVILQGTILTGWIIIQMMMLREINFLHVLFLLIGITLMLIGRYLRQFEY